jgi:hypothetical protein
MAHDLDPDKALVVQTRETTPTETDMDNVSNGTHLTTASGTPLLPRPIASLVSLFAQSTSLSLRIGSLFGGAAIAGARGATLTGLELSRAVVEGVLTKAGRDVAARSSGEVGKVEAESLLEKSVSAPSLI